MRFKKALVALFGVALIGGSFTIMLPAAADTANYTSWIEKDDPAPFNTTGGLVFYNAASINFGDPNADKTLNSLGSLKDVSGLAYTVKDSSSYAPSYQIGISGGTKDVTYARLVWEPYQQSPSLSANSGTYTDLEKGRWWAANVFVKNPDQSDPTKPTVTTTPFAGGVEGSQSKPQELSFFAEFFGNGTNVDFFGVKQGKGTESTSTVTHLEFAGKNVPLGDVDTTPYDSADISAATDPLQAKLDASRAELDATKDQLAQTKAALGAATSTTTATQAMVTATRNSLYAERAQRGVILGTKRVGKTVTAKLAHSVPGATLSFKWYVGGKKVPKATKSTLRLKRAYVGRTLSVKITTTWIDASAVSHTARTTAKYLRSTTIKR